MALLSPSFWAVILICKMAEGACTFTGIIHIQKRIKITEGCDAQLRERGRSPFFPGYSFVSPSSQRGWSLVSAGERWQVTAWILQCWQGTVPFWERKLQWSECVLNRTRYLTMCSSWKGRDPHWCNESKAQALLWAKLIIYYWKKHQ